MKTHRIAIKDSYFELVRSFPLVPIKTEGQYEDAIAFLRPLAVRDERSLDSGESAYLEALTQFVEDYEQSRHQIETAALGPLDILRYLMAENGLKPIDLGDILGSRSLASQLLNGKRKLSKTHIFLLADRFSVEPGLFLQRD